MGDSWHGLLQKEVKQCQYDWQPTVEAQLSLQNREKDPEAREWPENGAVNYEPDKVRNCNGFTVLCVLQASSMIQ